MKSLSKLVFGSIFLLSILTVCSRPAARDDKKNLDEYMSKAELFFEKGEIDSSKYYVDLCFSIQRDYPPARHLEGKIYLDKNGVYYRRLSANSLKKAVLAEEENPEYHYSLGVTLEEQGYYSNALDEYKKATELDSTDYRPLERMAEINKRIGLRYDDEKYFKRSLEASTAAATLTKDPEYFYQQGIVYYQMDDYDNSIKALQEGISLSDDRQKTAKLNLLLGTDYIMLDDYESAQKAFDNAHKGMTELAWDDMEDLRYLISPEEYRAYQEESHYNQKRMKNQLWGRLDPNPTTSINERQLVHFARYTHAQITYSLPDKNIDGWRTKRGEMYIRYGRPTSMDYILGTGGDASDAPKWVWRYGQFERPITLIFEDTFLNGDFDFPYPKKEWTAADYDNDPARLAQMLRTNVPQTFAFEAGTGPLEYFYMPKQFKGRRGKTDLEIFIAIPYQQMDFERDGEYSESTIEWRQILRYGSWKIADSAVVSRSYSVRASQVDNPNLSVADRLSLTAYPDTLLFAISIRDSLSGHAGIDSREVPLRDFFSGKVEISDMVLARRIDSPPDNKKHTRKDLAIISNLDNRYFVGEPIWLYFEIYNLKKDENGRTSYTLKQTVREKTAGGLLGGLKSIVSSDQYQEISISYSGAGLNSDENRILTIDASKLKPAEYTISIEVTDEISKISASVSEDIVLYR